MGSKKPIPEFRTEDEAQDFWSEHDSTEYIDWSKARLVAFPNLMRSAEESNGVRWYGQEN
jgi:hypothetical protein